MARYRTTRVALEIFPFLSIIVCAIGVISFMIAVTEIGGSLQVKLAKDFRSLTDQIAEQEKLAADRNAELARREAEREAEHKARLDRLMKMEQERKAREARAAEARQATQQEIADARKQLEELQAHSAEWAAIAELQKKEADIRHDIAEAQAALAALKAQIAALNAASASATSAKVVLPTVASTVKPIYIECSATGLTLYPERTTIATDKIDSDQTFKDLLDRVQADPGLAVDFLIRPDGIAAFDQARAVVQERSTPIPHGYIPLTTSGPIEIDDPNLSVGGDATAVAAAPATPAAGTPATEPAATPEPATAATAGPSTIAAPATAAAP
jgi:hypothetical protein